MFPNSTYILNPGTPVQNLSPHKNPHTNVYNSFHRSCQNMEATKMSFNRWMVKKLWYIQTMEYHSVIKRNELPSHKIWRNLKCILLSERKLSRKAPCCMIPTPWHSEESTTMDTVKSKKWLLGFQERGERMNGRNQEIFRAGKPLGMMLHSGYMSSDICPNPQNCKHSEA